MYKMYIELKIKIKSNKRLLIVAADKPKILQITSSQFITALDRICSFKAIVFFDKLRPVEQPDGPERILFSIPTCQIE